MRKYKCGLWLGLGLMWAGIVYAQPLDELAFSAIIKTNADAPEQTMVFHGPQAARENWRICAVLPNVSDSFWDEVIKGIKAEALHLGVTAVIYEASGYNEAGLQQQQRILNQRCAMDEMDMDAVLVAAVDSRGLEENLLSLQKKGIVIIDLINGYNSSAISAHALLENTHLGKTMADTIRAHLDEFPRAEKNSPLHILWVPGPAGVDWVMNADKGFQSVFYNDARVQITRYFWEPHYRVQSRELQKLLVAGVHFDLIVGTAPTVLAVNQLQRQQVMGELPVFAYYLTPDVQQLLDNGQLLNAVTNDPYLQGRIGVALAVNKLEHTASPYQVGPVPHLVLPVAEMKRRLELLQTQSNINSSAR